MAENKIMGIAEQGSVAKAQAIAQFGLDNGTIKTGDYTFIAPQDVVVDAEGNTVTQFVEMTLTVKNTKGNKRTAGFDLDVAVAEYTEVLAEREEKAAEKAAKAEAKAKKDAERAAAKAQIDAEGAEG